LSDEEGNTPVLRKLTIELWQMIRECEIAEIEEPDPHAPQRRHYDQAYSELKLQTELLSIAMGEDIPDEVERWLKFSHWQNGPPFKKRKKVDSEKEQVLRLSSEQRCKVAGPTRQPLKIANFGVRPAEFIALRSEFMTTAERVFKRHMENRFRFMAFRDLLQAEEDGSPLTSASEDDEDDSCCHLTPFRTKASPYFNDPEFMQDLFARQDSDCVQRPRFLPTSCGGIRRLRKRKGAFQNSEKKIVLADGVNVPPASCEVHEATTSFSVQQTDRSFSCGVSPDHQDPAPSIQSGGSVSSGGFPDDPRLAIDVQFSDEVHEGDIAQVVESVPRCVFPSTAPEEKAQAAKSVPAPVSHAERTQGDSLSPHFQELSVSDSE
jgi:hypothetical protein